MAKTKVDGVVEAVHYSQDGHLVWARAYERRGPTYSDLVLLTRDELISRLKAGKKFTVGQRQTYLASTFEMAQSITIVQENGQEFLASGSPRKGQDFLDGAPVV